MCFCAFRYLTKIAKKKDLKFTELISLFQLLLFIPFQVELSQEELQRIIAEAKQELGYVGIEHMLLPLFYLLALLKVQMPQVGLNN